MRSRCVAISVFVAAALLVAPAGIVVSHSAVTAPSTYAWGSVGTFWPRPTMVNPVTVQLGAGSSVC
jgi:hypothetical protein